MPPLFRLLSPFNARDTVASNPIEGTVLLERLRQWFGRSGEAGGPDDQPRRRGLAVSTCVLIAIVLWFTLSLREIYQDTIEIPAQVVNLPDDVALSEAPPQNVQVQVRGEGIELFRLHFDPPTLQIDGQQDEVNLEDQTLDLKSVVLEGISPRVVALRKERKIDKKVPIRLRGGIETPGSHDLLHPPRLEPDSILVSGARSIINALEYWPTVPFRRDDLKDSLVVMVPLADTLQGLVSRGPIATQLTAVARPFTSDERTIQVEVTGGVPSSERVVTLVPPTVRVRYRVPLSQYEAARRARDFFATVSYDQIRADTTGRVRPELHPPEGLALTDIEMTPSRLSYYERLVDQ